ncbi:CHAD domain-containing protein [Chthonobacter albigriseus]|uniref:CYTH and CHAD domain-containing protein n=1 Tax=Chthonobacter albigriseus TaxID=1683161 RepID=UPI0015EF36F4|nr:CHAD domain-containing protein [Chthonobacter albigriseus]
MASGTESELKFELSRDEFDALKDSSRLTDIAVGPARVDRLTTLYFDTPDERLRRSGASLRVRRSEAGFEQTVKIGGDSGSMLARRTECNVAVPGPEPDLDAIPDDDIRAAVVEALAGEAVVEAFTIAVERTSRTVTTTAGDTVDFVLDDGSVTTGDRREDLLEAEFELIDGDVQALFQVAATVLQGKPVRFSRTVKSERGYALLAGEGVGARKPLKAVAAPIDEGMTVEEGLRSILRSCVAQIAGNLPVVLESDDPEGPHQLRVGLRRLRTALTVFKSVVDPAAAARLVEDVRWLGQEVGTLRDLDVLAEEIIAPCAGYTDMSALETIIARRRGTVRGQVRSVLSGARTGSFLLGLAAYAETRGWLSDVDVEQSAKLSAPLEEFATAVLQRQWNKVVKTGRRVDELDPEERHDLRKRFKKLRYSIEFFEPLLSRREVRRIHRDTKRAQEILGYLNDVRLAHGLDDLVRDGGGKGRVSVAAARAIGFCQGWHEAHAKYVWEDARQAVALEPMRF